MTSTGAEVSAVPTASVVPPQSLISGKRFRQRPLGPAPFASFEDSSDELDSPPESARPPGLPNIKEDPASQLATPVTNKPPDMNQLNLTEEEERGLQEALAASLDTPGPPRIDISRASSSSQHEDSITSSPDAETGHNLGYKEDGTLELKTSTEELYYVQEPGTVEETEAKRRREKRMQKQLRQDFGDTQSEHDFKERKDSNCSVGSDFGGHLYIGGRTSRLSSVGSAASGNSVASAASHLSGASRLSATSKVSRGSRSPSPHKMMLETSFCGGKPAAPAHIVDAESAPALVSHMEKPSSRPPSRLRSRSPSPHKMLLETSFCGTKSIGASISAQETAKPVEARRRSSNTLSAEIITTAEIANQPSVHVKTSPTFKAEKPTTKVAPIPKPNTTVDADEIQKADEIIKPASPRPHHRKPVNLAQMMERKIALEIKQKNRKVISLRDIPGDEIIIPLTGPELDFEELIRKGSPNLPRKEQSEDNPDVIFIPLHSPPKEKVDNSNFKASDPIPIKGSNREPKPYEVCEDGSIFIPLHTPEEERNARTFEEQIKRVERELQRVKAAEAERRQREREQQKPATLDLNDGASSRSRLSHSYPGKQDLLSGSRTPSPGSSLSRKSSFASIFRRSELTASPDSPAGHSARKKSGTFSNILNPNEGSREMSRSRSKERSKERLSSTGVSRSPSFKKNVLGNLFGGKKKDDGRESRSNENETPEKKREIHAPISTAIFQGQDMGDYILIPLKDPSDPQYEDPPEKPEEETEMSHQQELESPAVAEQGSDYPGSYRSSRDMDHQSEIRSHLSTVGAAYRSPVEETPSRKLADSPVQALPSSSSKQSIKPQPQDIISTPEPTNSPVEARPTTPKEKLFTEKEGTPEPEILDTLAISDEKIPLENEKPTLQPHGQEASVQDSSVDLDDDLPREEIVTVSTDGIRKLKLPPEPGDLEEDHERKGLVVQDSLEDELPYVPTTLPLERSIGVTLVPAKERLSEIVTCPIDRPRSTTPKNPANLEEFLARRDSSSIPDKEKMKISLPRVDSTTGRVKSPRRFSGKGKTWFEFAEAGLPCPREGRKNSLTKSPSPPPLPPRADQSLTSPQDLTDCAPATAWINFEELPEKIKLPKRITTLPMHRGPTDGAVASDKSSAPVVYSYVNPEDCQCECHDTHVHSKLVAGMQERGRTRVEVNGDVQCEQCDCGDEQQGNSQDIARELEECPLLDCNSDDESISRRESDWIEPGSRLEIEQRVLSDSSFEAMSIGPDHSPCDNGSEMIPFAMDLDVHSNRSSIISQNEDISPDITS